MLSPAFRAQVLGLMVEGKSMRAISRVMGANKNTIVKLLEDTWNAFSYYQDRTMRNLTCKRLQVDEIWSFVYAKAKNGPTARPLLPMPAIYGRGWQSTRIRN